MKNYLTIFFALVSLTVFGKIYPDSDYAGSNVVNVTGPTWITMSNGTGSNLTITNTLTIISGGGLTTLTNQPPFTNGMLIPLMTSSNTPSGVVTTSSELVGNEGYKSLTRRPSDSWISLSYGFVQYQFTNQVVATVFSWLTSSNVYGANQISVFGGGGSISYPLTNYTVTASNDGTNFTTLLTISTTNNQMNGYYQLNNSSAYSIYRVNNLTNIGQSDGSVFNWNLFNFSLPATNLIPVQLTVQSNSYPLISGNTNASELHVNSGISIDGNGDSKIGWSVNGIPVQQGYAVSTNANSTVSSNSTSITTGTINYFVSCDSGIISLTNSAASIPPVFDSLDPNYFSHNALPAGATFTSSFYGYRYSSPYAGIYDAVVKGYYNQYPNYVGPVYRYYVYLPTPVASTTPVQSISAIDSLIAALKAANIWTNKLDLVLPFATGYVLCDGDNLLGLTNYPVSWFGSLSNSYSHTTNGIVAAGTNCYASVNWNYGTSFSGATPSNAFFGAWIVNQGSTNTQPLALFTDTNLNPNAAISASYWSNAASPFFADGISSTNMEALSFPLPQTNDLWVSVNRWTNTLNSTYGNLAFTQSPTNQFNNSAPLFLIGNPTSTNSFGTIGMLIVGKGLSQQDQTNLAAIVAQFEFNMGRQQGQAGISQVTAPVQTSLVPATTQLLAGNGSGGAAASGLNVAAVVTNVYAASIVSLPSYYTGTNFGQNTYNTTFMVVSNGPYAGIYYSNSLVGTAGIHVNIYTNLLTSLVWSNTSTIRKWSLISNSIVLDIISGTTTFTPSLNTTSLNFSNGQSFVQVNDTATVPNLYAGSNFVNYSYLLTSTEPFQGSVIEILGDSISYSGQENGINMWPVPFIGTIPFNNYLVINDSIQGTAVNNTNTTGVPSFGNPIGLIGIYSNTVALQGLKPSYVIMSGGLNDINAYGLTADQTLPAITNIWFNIRASGKKVVAWTPTSASALQYGVTSFNYTNLLVLDSYIRSLTNSWDILIDADSVITASDLGSDGIHPNQYGVAKLQSAVVAALTGHSSYGYSGASSFVPNSYSGTFTVISNSLGTHGWSIYVTNGSIINVVPN